MAKLNKLTKHKGKYKMNNQIKKCLKFLDKHDYTGEERQEIIDFIYKNNGDFSLVKEFMGY